MAALAVAPHALWLPLAAAVTPLLEAAPPALSLADMQQLLLRLQVGVTVHQWFPAVPVVLTGIQRQPAHSACLRLRWHGYCTCGSVIDIVALHRYMYACIKTPLLSTLQGMSTRRYALEAPLPGLDSAPAPDAAAAAGQAAAVSRALASGFARAHVAEMVAA